MNILTLLEKTILVSFNLVTGLPNMGKSGCFRPQEKLPYTRTVHCNTPFNAGLTQNQCCATASDLAIVRT